MPLFKLHQRLRPIDPLEASSWAARQVTLVRDNLQQIVAVLLAAFSRVELVIRSGGRGATGDDLTRIYSAMSPCHH